MDKPKAHVADYKKKIVSDLVALLKKYPIVGAINMENLPAAQLQNMRGQLRDKVVMFMTKRRLMKLAIEQAKGEKKGLEKIEEHLGGMPALLLTDENPFTLFKFIKKNKSKAPAKAGQIAPIDIIIPAGPTPFAPGPVISELGSLGIKSKVEEGKIVIQEDAVVCKEGEEISAPLAGMLARLSIKPMEIGLDLVAVLEDGVLYPKSVLDVDEEQFMADFSAAASNAFNLSIELGFITPDNRNAIIGKLFREAKAVALEAGVLADAVVEEIVSKAARQANALSAEVGELPSAAPAEEAKAEEKPSEEKPAETPAEEKAAAEAPAEEKPAEQKAEEKPETPKEEPKEEKPAEEPKEEPKEEKKEEPPKEEKPAEPAPETPKEEPKEEEKPREPEIKEEPPEEVKEEPPKEEEKPAEAPKEEPKEEEKPEEPKEEPAEAPKEEVKEAPKEEVQSRNEETDEKVADMVKKFKDKAEGNIPSAEDLVGETKEK